MSISIDELKAAARGQELQLLTEHGFTSQDLDGRGHPCPNCGGTDRFSCVDKNAGAVLCRKCFNQGNGDWIAAIRWRNNWTLPETIEVMSKYFGLNGHARSPADIVESVARAKRMPIKSARAFGMKADYRGKLEVARVPMYDQLLVQCSCFDMALISPEFEKGMSAKGQPVGLFVTIEDPPKPGDIVLVVEGVKDAAALHGLGFKVVGLPGSKLSKKFARVFAGCHVIIIPDRDKTGEESARITAARLAGVAASVRIATLPGELKAKDGDGVREVLASADGEQLLRQAIDDAAAWEAGPEEPPQSGDDWTAINKSQGRTDRANSRRFLAAYGDRVRYVFPWGKWLVWVGTHWDIDAGGAVLRLAMAIADQVWMDAKEFLTKEVVDFAVSTSGHGKLAAMLKLAAADVATSPEDLDAHPYLLNCPNGTVDLRTGELRPHRREDLITKLCPTVFNPNATSYIYDRFLEGIFVEQPVIDFVQRFSGYAITGDVSEQVMVICYGGGSNGKSTLLDTWNDVIGGDYSGPAPPSLLIEKKTEAHPTELADLFGKRLIVAQETAQGARLAESLVKQLTGGDKISARRMREDFWAFPPTHKLTLCTNHRPRVKGTDHAIWRRLVLLPFNQKFWNPDKGEEGPPELRQDKALPDKLRTEAPGILAWMVRGCLEWHRSGLKIPDSIRIATAKYRSDSDTIGRFVDDCCLKNDAVRVKFSDLYSALESWCEECGDTMPSRKYVGEWLGDQGFTDKTSNGRWYLGLALKAEAAA